MTGLRLVCIAAFIVLFLSAGCAGAPAAREGSSSDIAPAPEAVATADTGSLAGLIVGDDQLPIAGAEVAIVSANLTAQSDTTGRFTFNGLAPGDVVVAAGKLGYESHSKRVTVVAGETVNVTLILAQVQLVESRVESFIGNGFIQIGASVPSVYVGATHAGLGVVPEAKESWEYVATTGAVAAVSTGTWVKSAAGSPTWMYLGVTTSAESKASAEDKSAVTVHLLNMSVPEKQKINVQFSPAPGCYLGTGNPTACTVDPQNRLAQIVVQQKTTVFTDVFYVNEPAPDHVAGPKA